MRTPLLSLVGIQAVIAYEWASAGFEKVQSNAFVTHMTDTLTAFAAKNPYTWYTEQVIRPSMAIATPLAYAIQYGELLVGVGLFLAILLLLVKASAARTLARVSATLALVGSLFLNANFYFGAGHTSPSTHGVNMIMFWCAFFLLIAWQSDEGPRTI